jgi:hypothetical protein
MSAFFFYVNASGNLHSSQDIKKHFRLIKCRQKTVQLTFIGGIFKVRKQANKNTMLNSTLRKVSDPKYY